MSRMDYFRQGGTPFDSFLYAVLGQDRAGNTVSVLSALARLGHDPWDEAAELSALSSAAAQSRLQGLMARFPDIPAEGRDPRATIPRLVALLPQSSSIKLGAGTILPARVKLPTTGVLIAVAMVVLFLVQTFILGSDGSGD
jgi:hypothetical protein